MKKMLLAFVVLIGALAAFAGVASAAQPNTTQTLSTDEVAGLQWMREEEKLARDVYKTLGAEFSLPIFQNIARSEQTHMDAVEVLLNRYGVPDPVGNNGVGMFTDPQLQALYDDLVARGSTSLASALAVGVEIERLDIGDLETRLAQTDKADIRQVYANLERGSYNHLRAFTTRQR
ncbi:MAG: DUF2202 domain-containing protein [Anaerolineae bacterium]